MGQIVNQIRLMKNSWLIKGLLLVIVVGCLWRNKNGIEQKQKEIVPTLKPIPTETLLKSSYDEVSLYTESFKKAYGTKKETVLAAITSHHFLAKDLIAKTFAGIDETRIKTVIIVSPDHFGQIEAPKCLAQTVKAKWSTPFGELEADENIIDKLLKKEEFCENLNNFRGEHGIYTLIPFVKNYLPEVKIVPIILKQKNNYNVEYYRLGQEMAKNINQEETLLVISSDFSHEVSDKQSKLNDKESIKYLPNKKVEEVKFIENDCKQCSAFLDGYLADIETDFKLIFNQNSFEISRESPGSVTSYVGGYFVKKI
jgi:MEMO1 family protein